MSQHWRWRSPRSDRPEITPLERDPTVNNDWSGIFGGLLPKPSSTGRTGLWDDSMHGWLEDRAADDQALIWIHDDATEPANDWRGWSSATTVRRTAGTMIAYLRRHGRP